MVDGRACIHRLGRRLEHVAGGVGNDLHTLGGLEGAAQADLVLPGATYAEKHGTYVNIEGRVQRSERAAFAPGEAREDWTIFRAVSDLLGSPFEPMKQALSGNEIWTYPMRIAGHPTPKWFLAHISPDGVLRETYLIDDPNWVRQDSPRSR